MGRSVADLSHSDVEVRCLVYDRVIKDGKIPLRAALGEALGRTPADVDESLRRLAEAHQLVLQRDGEILMANPFSAVATPFPVSINGHSWYGNCIWDAMGIVAMLQSKGSIQTSCGCCGTAMAIRVPDDCTD
jgi:hypothetical protein